MTQINKFNNIIPIIGMQNLQKSVITQPAIAFKGLQADTVSFTASNKVSDSPEIKMVNYAREILDKKVNLQEGEKLVIKATRDQIPFVNIMLKEAYQKGSGYVVPQIIEPKLEALREKYDAPTFDYKKQPVEGAKSIDLTQLNPYLSSGLSNAEKKAVISTIKPDLPANVQKELAIDPKEIMNIALSAKKGQPLVITAHREHEDIVSNLIEYVYESRGPVPIDVTFSESDQNNFTRTMLENVKNIETLKETPPNLVKKWQETLDKGATRFVLYGENPKALEGLDPEREPTYTATCNKAIRDIKDECILQYPWNIRYAPTTALTKLIYPEYKDLNKAMLKAAKDANLINRTGKLKEHFKKLDRVSKKLNDLIVNEGLNTIKYVSMDPKTKKPDGKTNLTVGLTDKSRFQITQKTTPQGQTYVANTPSEEIFTSPHKDKTFGVVSATLPLTLGGNIIEDIRMEFKDGKIARDEEGQLKVYAKTPEQQEMLRKHIEKNEDADMLGEASLVAGSPIAKLNRIFNSTLMDENAACHIAIGNSYAICIEGASKIKDPKERKEYLKQLGANSSATHNDFMIGGPNVNIIGVTKDGKEIPIIEKDEFVL